MKILTLPCLLLALMALSQAAGSPASLDVKETEETHSEVANDKPETGEKLPEGSPDGTEETENKETHSEVKPDLVKRSAYCPTGWSQHKSHCFRYIPKARRWAQAERNCVSMGANLASVHNVEEYHFIQNLIRIATHLYTETWIGGSDAQEHGVWLWSDGSASHYTDWCQGHPSYGQHCLQMNYSNNKCWDDLECHGLRPYVCSRLV